MELIEEIIKEEDALKLDKYLEDNNFKVGPQRKIMKQIAKSNWDVSSFKSISPRLKWFYFNINLLRFKSFDETMNFIDNNLDYFDSWYSVDGTLMFMNKKGLSFDKIYSYSKKYTKDKKREFVCRFGYLLFFLIKMDEKEVLKIEKLLHDDSRYYVQMMEAWLLCEIVARNPNSGYKIIKRSNLDYNILGKAIQKCLDSFRISEEMKRNLNELRSEKKKK